MTEKPPIATFPRRDDQGRVARLSELVVASLGGVLVALLPLALIDGIIVLIGTGQFGSASGWLTVILPALIFFDDLRAWRGYGARFLIAIVAAAAGIGLGMLAAGLFRGTPPMLSGSAGAAVAATVYSLIWHPGIRWVTAIDDRGPAGR